MSSLNWKKKLVFIFTTLIIFLFSLELFLQVSGFALRLGVDYKELNKRNKRNKIKSTSAYRIMILGESTSDNYWKEGEDGAWPNQLETLLNQSGLEAQVINLAKGGNTTALMMSNLLDNLDTYKPNMVISMMGINDWGETSFIGEVSDANLFLNNLRTVKLFRWIYFRYWASQFEDVHTKFPEDYLEKEQEYFELFLAAPNDPANVLKQVYTFPGSRCDKAVYLTRVVERFFHLETKRTPIQYYLIDQAFGICPHHDYVLFWYFHHHTLDQNRRLTCRSKFPILKKYLLNIPDRTFSYLLNCYMEGLVPPELQVVLDFRKLSLAKKGINKTAIHYNFLYKTLQQRKIKLVAMQYPTLDISILKNYFTDSKEIEFVENKLNFAPYMTQAKKDEVFSDFFARTWGHTTEKGHRLIAQNVFPIVRDIIKSLEKK